MIGKNEEFEDDNSTNGKRINLLSERKKILQDSSTKVKEEVKLCFERLAKVLQTRENQLIRQIEAVHNQRLTIVQSNRDTSSSVPPIRINLDEKRSLEEFILNFGELRSSDGNGIDVKDAEPYKIEDYEAADRDHVTFDKSIENAAERDTTLEGEDKLDDFPDSPRDLSLDASSDADVTSENEITVLANHNYSRSSDGLGETVSPILSRGEATYDRSDEGAIKNNDSLNDSSMYESENSARISGTRQDSIGPESADNSSTENADGSNGEDLIADANGDPSPTGKKAQDDEKHPKQIQQWLRQILVETETEPTIHEIEQFAEISKSRFREFQFPLET